MREAAAQMGRGSTPPGWLRSRAECQRWIIARPVGTNLHPSVVVKKDLAKISPLLSQTVGSPLAHANAVTIPLSPSFEHKAARMNTAARTNKAARSVEADTRRRHRWWWWYWWCKPRIRSFTGAAGRIAPKADQSRPRAGWFGIQRTCWRELPVAIAHHGETHHRAFEAKPLTQLTP